MLETLRVEDAMSLSTALPETVFDAETPVRLSRASTGTLMEVDEFLRVDDFEEGWRYELLNGVVIVSPPPSAGERVPNDELAYWLRLYRDTHPQGRILDDTAPEQEIETSHGIRRADRVIWTGLGRRPDTRTDIPTIVIEFVSETSRDRRRDYEQKRIEYAEVGVTEYWIVDRFRRTLTVCCGTEPPRIVRESETYSTERLPGFELPMGKLLAVADRWKPQP